MGHSSPIVFGTIETVPYGDDKNADNNRNEATHNYSIRGDWRRLSPLRIILLWNNNN